MTSGIVLLALIGCGAYITRKWWLPLIPRKAQHWEWEFLTTDNGQTVHVIPTNDRQDHIAIDDCICAPADKTFKRLDDTYGVLVVHHTGHRSNRA